MEAGNFGAKLAAAMADLEAAKAAEAAAAAAKKVAALEAIELARQEEAAALAEIKAAMRHAKFKASVAAPVQEKQDGEEEADDDSDEDPLPPYIHINDKASLLQALGGPPREKVILIDNLPSMREAVEMLAICDEAPYNVSISRKNMVRYIANHHEILDKKVRRITLASLKIMPKNSLYRKMLHEQGQAITLMGRHMGGNFGRRADAVGQWMAALSALDDQPESSPLLWDLRAAVNRLLNYPIALR